MVALFLVCIVVTPLALAIQEPNRLVRRETGEAIKIGIKEVENTDTVLDLMRSMKTDATCQTLERAGPKVDGGYYICDEIAKGSSMMISIGIRGFDPISVNMSEKFGVPVDEYDCFDQRPYLCPDNAVGCTVRFHPVCMGTSDKQEGQQQFQSLQHAVDEHAGNTTSANLLLKIDCEGCEWDTLAAASEATLGRFKMIMGEFHWFDQEANHAKYLSVMTKLLKTHSLVHVHGCNCYGQIQVKGTLYRMPKISEFLMVRKDLAQPSEYKGNKYLKDDAPICPHTPEFTEEDYVLP